MKPLSREKKDSFYRYIENERRKGNAQIILKYIPLALRKRWQQQYDGSWDNFQNALLSKTPRTIRVNTLKSTPQEFEQIAKKYGWNVIPHSAHETIYRFSSEKWVSYGRTTEYQNGIFYSQGLASQLSGLVLGVQKGERVLDMAAAPGSKTSQLAMYMKNTGKILAVDNSTERMQILKENCARLGVKNVQTRVTDARNLKSSEVGNFDRVLLDAPCSSEGIVRNKPHILLQWDEGTVRECAGLQKELILKGFELLKSGGRMVYSTCTFSEEENERVIEWLQKKKSSEIKHIRTKRILPWESSTIGFFVGKIIRK